ncbi:MAG TPA: TetR/AcrR family transcriptional regulator [Kofleriaceae bacterium]|jgi:AcrR family transcriptional regulator
MYRQVKTTPRKRPRQDRSKATVDAILAATAQVLVSKGFDGLTTNAVAEAAGCSIGSLYQYFPNKEALVAALIEHHLDIKSAQTVAELHRVATLPVQHAVRAMIVLTMESYRDQPDLKRVLIEQVPRVGRMAKIAALHAGTLQMVTALLRARQREMRIGDPDMAAFILMSAIEAICQRAALFEPARLRDPALIDEATTMVVRYLGLPDD